MLERLTVEGLGIIDRVVLEPGAGLVALTGETGAGKSLLVQSLSLLAGQRAASEMVREGDRRLRVEAVFCAVDAHVREVVEALGVTVDEDVLVVRREVTAEGRSRAWMNDATVTMGALQQWARAALAVHGQHEQYGLADPQVQRRMVDEFAGHDELRQRVAEQWARWRAAAATLAEVRAAQANQRDRLDTIAFQLNEIDSVAPSEGEDETLRGRREVLRHSARLTELGASVLERLFEGDLAVSDQLARAAREVREMSGLGLKVGEAAERLEEAGVLTDDVVRELQDRLMDVVADPGELEAVESRLHQLESLMLKYGGGLAVVLEHRRSLVAEREALGSLESRLEETERAADAELTAYAEAARKLHRSRLGAGEAMLARTGEVLGRLGMGGTELAFEWTPVDAPDSPLEWDGRRVEFDAEGVERCELQISPNPGEPLLPMAKIASGGELSRLHLALRTALRTARRGVAMTLLFDEVDSGLGGPTAAALGRLLADLAVTDQVLVVTHLPQVAAAASRQLTVEKVRANGRTVTTVRCLNGEERVHEVARMLAGGTVGDSALEHARALLEE
jgi:DNA repair protein RecN (Recombination protein N)